MSTFVFRLKAPRPTFALDMSDEEREIMARHAEHWRPWVESGQMVIFGPVLDASGSWGLGVVEADDEQEVRAFAAGDPASSAPLVEKTSRSLATAGGDDRNHAAIRVGHLAGPRGLQSHMLNVKAGGKQAPCGLEDR